MALKKGKYIGYEPRKKEKRLFDKQMTKAIRRNHKSLEDSLDKMFPSSPKRGKTVYNPMLGIKKAV